MCKLSPNVVPKVYNRLQSSFLSLAWPWSGRSLPQGEPVGVLGPWNGAQCGRAPVHPKWIPDTPTPHTDLIDVPYIPCWPPTPPDAPTPLLAPMLPDTSYPCWLLSSYTPASCQCPLTPPTPLPVGVLGPWTGTQCGWLPVHLPPPLPPDTLTPPTGPQCSLHPLPVSKCPLMPSTPPAGPNAPDILQPPAGPLSPLHPLPVPKIPWCPLLPLTLPWCPLHPAMWECWTLDWCPMWPGS